MSRQHRSYFNHIAESWRNDSPSQLFVDNLIDFDIRPNDVVVDVGCGAGCAARQIAEIQPKASVIAIDVSEKMLAAARENLTNHSARFVCSDACILGLKSKSVQKIICYSTFPHLKNQRAALREFYRSLSPGGKALIFHNCCSRRLNTYHAKIKDVVAFDKLPKAQMLGDMLRQAGFAKINVIEQPNLYHIVAWKGMDE